MVTRHNDKDAQVEAHVLSFIATHRRPDRVLRDSALAAYYYEAYVSEPLPRHASKLYYLYIWLCSREHRSVSVTMSDYRYFSDDGIDLKTVSYRDFTQMYADPIVDPTICNIHHTCRVNSVIYHSYPISLKSVMDNFPLAGIYRCILAEGQLIATKCVPQLMRSPTLEDHTGATPDDGTLAIHSAHSTIKCDRRYTTIECTDEVTHKELVTLMCRLVGDATQVEHTLIQHTFSFPSREINYSQVLQWLAASKVPYSHVSTTQATTNQLITGTRCTINARKLDRHTCYDNGRYEAYRLKGDCVLEVTVDGPVDRQTSEQAMRNMCAVIRAFPTTYAAAYTYQDPLTTDAQNIAKLRATNSIVFDGMYCRKAPPQVQPLVIAEQDVPTMLAAGRMVLIYDGAYYTTSSDRHKYIGMINRFGDYDPSRPYVPIIRTYRKNHLLSKKFKEFKAYLLRHSPDPCVGAISKDDLLLPPQLAQLYTKPLVNPPLNVASIHTKKTSVINSIKVSSGEVPDYVKSMLGSPDVRRTVISPRGTGLLEACSISEQGLLGYIEAHHDTLLDLVPLTMEDIRTQVQEGNLDHRLYGKAIEGLTDKCVMVFAVAGMVPYRCTNYGGSGYTLLFLSDIGVYDTLTVLGNTGQLDANVATLKKVPESKYVDVSKYMKVQPRRPIDHVETMIKLVSYIGIQARKCNIDVVYVVIEEHRCLELVEQVYTRPIYYEGYTRSRGAKFIESLVVQKSSIATTAPNIRWVCYMLRPLIYLESLTRIHVLSPVDMSLYHLWDHNLEDCLYSSVNSYALLDKEEVQHKYRTNFSTGAG